MKKSIGPMALLAAVLLTSCSGIDLKVAQVTHSWTATEHSAVVTVTNAGNLDAGPFLLYIDGEAGGAHNVICAQFSKEYNGLAAGASQVVTVNFNDLPYTQQVDLGPMNTVNDIVRIHIHVDAKKQVAETDEQNNDQLVGPPLQ